MELVYLWVEEYKNIRKQGFNFSPRFECSYEEGSKELTIDEKEHLENFFGKDINVTAIVGENGSGKSNILKSILQIENFDNNYILVYRDNDVNYFTSNILNIITKVFKDENKLLNNTITYINCMHEHYAFRNYNYRIVEVDKKSVINILVSNEAKNDIFQISTFMYLPITIEITYKQPQDLINKFINHISSNREELDTLFRSLNDYSFHQFLIIKYLENHKKKFDLSICKDESILKYFFRDDLDKLQSIYHDFIKFVNTKIFQFKDNKEKLELYTKDYFDYFEFDLIDNEKKKYNDLSTGEQTIFAQLLQISFYIDGGQNLLFLFDEPELSLHPQWQKQYMNEVIKLIQNSSTRNHFMFTSHSPFLLSDLPKENILFLSKYNKDDTEVKNKKQKIGNCKIVDGLKSKKQTFGANIHTLLSDGFFMDGGLMGTFAKDKIQNIINFLNDKKSNLEKKDIYPTIELIGEPFLKQKLKEQYFTKYQNERDIDNEINILTKKLEELNDVKNSK